MEVDLAEALRRQVEFYLSDANLINDTFLRKQLSSDGDSVPLSLLVTFNRLKDLLENAEKREDGERTHSTATSILKIRSFDVRFNNVHRHLPLLKLHHFRNPLPSSLMLSF